MRAGEPLAATADAPVARRADAQRNRDKLLAAALEEFEREGCQASLEAIARRAGVGIGTLYRHFTTREALILAAHGHEVEQLSGAVTTLLAELAPERALREWMDRLATLAITKRWMADALNVAAKARGPSPSETYLILVAALDRLLAASVATGAIRDDIGGGDVMLAVSGLWYANTGGHGDGDARAQRLLDLVMDGLRAGA